MLGLEKIADLFDEIHAENQRFIERGFSDWTSSVYQENGEDGWFYASVATAATAEALYKVAGGLGAGLVDTLRFGEGIKSGTAWGVAQDGLRGLSIVGGAFRVARLAAAELKLGGAMTCTISSSSKAAVISGNRLSADLLFEDAAKLFGGRQHVMSNAFHGTPTPIEYDGLFKILDMKVAKSAVSSVDDVVNLAKTGRGPVVFGVRWAAPAGVAGGGHTMVAYRGLFGEIRFADQMGRTVTDISKIGPVASTYGTAMVVEEAAVVQALRWGAVGQFLSVPVVQMPPEGMAKLEKEVRKATGRERPGAKKTDKGGGKGGGSGHRPAPGGPPPVDWRHPAISDDARLVLAAIPAAPRTVEAGQLMADTKMSLSRVVNALSSLAQANLVEVTAWSNRNGAKLPAMVRRKS